MSDLRQRAEDCLFKLTGLSQEDLLKPGMWMSPPAAVEDAYIIGYKDALRDIRNALVGFHNAKDEETRLSFSEQVFELLKELTEAS